MKKIIITIPASVLVTDAMGLALFAARMKTMVSQSFFLKRMNESIEICLN